MVLLRWFGTGSMIICIVQMWASSWAAKHLRVLRQGGVVQSVPGEDRRLAFFRIPPANQPEPGLLDYGLLQLDLRVIEVPEPRLQVRA